MEVSLAPEVPEYPKIETLYERDTKTFKVTDAIRCPEFAAINRWRVTEKIDGTNVRIALRADNTLFFGGRTDAAQMPPFLLDYMRRTFTLNKLVSIFRPEGKSPLVVLFGEGYGARIQKGGGNYRPDPSVRLFDIWIDGVWLTHESVEEYAKAMGVGTAPTLGVLTTDEAIAHVRDRSLVAVEDGGPGCQHEGIIARSDPLMLTRMGHRILWKLKGKDFA